MHRCYPTSYEAVMVTPGQLQLRRGFTIPAHGDN